MIFSRYLHYEYGGTLIINDSGQTLKYGFVNFREERDHLDVKTPSATGNINDS